jgi:hypothetical protein
MSLAIIRLFLGGALKKAGAWLSHRSFWQIMFGVALLLAGIQTLRLWSEQRHAHKIEAQLSKSEAARKADRDAYTKAQSDAAAKNKAQVAKIEQQQQKVTDDVEARYRADLARLRSERVRSGDAANQRPAGGSGSGQAGATPSGSGGQAVPLSGPELLQARETELQLNALIDFVLNQSAIDPNGEAK